MRKPSMKLSIAILALIIIVVSIISVVAVISFAGNSRPIIKVDIDPKIQNDLTPNGGIIEMDWYRYSNVYLASNYSIHKSSWSEFVNIYRQIGSNTSLLLDRTKQVIWVLTSAAQVSYCEYSLS